MAIKENPMDRVHHRRWGSEAAKVAKDLERKKDYFGSYYLHDDAARHFLKAGDSSKHDLHSRQAARLERLGRTKSAGLHYAAEKRAEKAGSDAVAKKKGESPKARQPGWVRQEHTQARGVKKTRGGK